MERGLSRAGKTGKINPRISHRGNAYTAGLRFYTVVPTAVTAMAMTMTTRDIDKRVWQSSRFFSFSLSLSLSFFRWGSPRETRGSARMEYICENNGEFFAGNKGEPAAITCW